MTVIVMMNKRMGTASKKSIGGSIHRIREFELEKVSTVNFYNFTVVKRYRTEERGEHE